MNEKIDYKAMSLEEKRAKLAEIAAARRLEIAPTIGRSACDTCVFAPKCVVRDENACDGSGDYSDSVSIRPDYKKQLKDPKQNTVMAQPKPRPAPTPKAKPAPPARPKRAVPPGETFGSQIAEMLVETFSFGAMKRVKKQKRAASKAA